MKRIAGAFMLLAGLGGCMQTGQAPSRSPFGQAPRATQTNNASSYQGAPMARGNTPNQGVAQAGYVAGNNPRAGTNLIQAGYLKTDDDCANNCNAGPGQGSIGDSDTGAGYASSHGHGHAPGLPNYKMNGGILPVPPQGPAGAVAAIGALPFRMPQQPMNMRTSVNFASPDGMRVTWYGPNGWNEQPLITPTRYNFLQGGVYRMRISSIANRLEKVYYPTIEIVPAQESTATFLAHSSVPVTFTDEDFEQVDSGNFLVKVVYLPNPNNQDLAAVSGPNELISTRLEPGIDPIVEAQRRGTILLIVRLGNIDLNAPNSPAMDAPNPFMMQRPPQGVPPQGAPPTDPHMPPPEGKPIPLPLPGTNPPEQKKPVTLPFIRSLDKKSVPDAIPEIKPTSPEPLPEPAEKKPTASEENKPSAGPKLSSFRPMMP